MGVAATTLTLTCGYSEPVGPGELVATLRVQPDTVLAGDTFHVTVVIQNPTADSIGLGSPSSCILLPEVLRGGQRQEFGRTAYYCLNVVSHFWIPPGDSLVVDFELVALLIEDQPRFHHVVLPPVGEYTVWAEMHIELRALEASLVAKPGSPRRRRAL